MDLSKLNSLSDETLRAMNTHIVSVIRQRQAQRQFEAGRSLKIGGRATFVDKRGRTVTVRVDKINVKTVNCTELNDRGIAMAQWRVAPSFLTPLGKGDTPETAAVATW